MKAKSKKRINKHVVHRSEQRYGYTLNSDRRSAIVRKIQNSESTGIKRVSNTKTLFMVEHEGEKILVLYSKARKLILTVYPKYCKEYKEFINEQKTKKNCGEVDGGESSQTSGFDVKFTERMLDLQETL
jgi:hypothetical protein